MISAPADFQAAYICDFCVEICTSIIADRAKDLADAMKHGLALLRGYQALLRGYQPPAKTTDQMEALNVEITHPL